MIRDFIDLPVNGPMNRGQLVRRQPETDVPGRKPDLLPWMIHTVGIAALLASAWLLLMSQYCPLKVDVNGVPHPLALLEPIVHSWNV